MATVTCLCPPDGTRHPAGDEVTFKERLGFREVVHFQKAIGWFREETPDADVPATLAFLSEWYLLNCIASWTLVDEKGKPLPVSRANIEAYLLTNVEAALELADVADEQYTEVLLVPLGRRASTSSPPTPIRRRTSATPGSGATRTRSKRSSTTSTPTDDIVTMSASPAGASS